MDSAYGHTLGQGAKKQALVLSGGGANGAYEVGVVKALLSGKSSATDHQPLDVDVYTGTSIGSYNAAFMVSQWHEYGHAVAANLESIWTDQSTFGGFFHVRLDPFEWLDPRQFCQDPLGKFMQLRADCAHLAWDWLRRAAHLFAYREEPMSERFVRMFNIASFLSNEAWVERVRGTIDFRAIRSSTKELRIAATDWLDGTLKIFSNRDMTDQLGAKIVLASSSIPVLLEPADVGSKSYVDGAVLMNTPLSPAIDAGAEIMHVVYLDPEVERLPYSPMRDTVGDAYRSQIIAWAHTVNNEIEDIAFLNGGMKAMRRMHEQVASHPAMERAEKELRSSIQELMGHRRLGTHPADYKPLTIHRYYPQSDLGGGSLGLLNFHPQRLRQIIDRGFEDAVCHDCKAAKCVLP